VFYGYWVPRIALRYAARVWLDDSQDITEDDFGGRRMGMVLWPQIANRPRGHPLNPRRPIWNHLKHTNQAKVENTIHCWRTSPAECLITEFQLKAAAAAAKCNMQHATRGSKTRAVTTLSQI